MDLSWHRRMKLNRQNSEAKLNRQDAGNSSEGGGQESDAEQEKRGYRKLPRNGRD